MRAKSSSRGLVLRQDHTVLFQLLEMQLCLIEFSIMIYSLKDTIISLIVLHNVPSDYAFFFPFVFISYSYTSLPVGHTLGTLC